MKESHILRACINWLYYNKVFVWRNNTGSYKTERGDYIRYGLAGSPDIIGLLPNGKFLGLEIKSEKGRLRESQIAFKERIEKNNGVYIVVRSIDDLERELKPLI